MPKGNNNWSSLFKKLSIRLRGQLFSNMLTVATVSIIVKGVSFFKEILVADTYGVSMLLDTYLIAVLVPSFIQNVFIGSYRVVFIPNYIAEKVQLKNTKSFQGSSFVITIILALFMTCVVYFGIDIYLEKIFPGHDSQYYRLIKTQLWIILPCILLWAISSLISGLMTVENEYFYSSLNNIFVPIVTIIFLLFFQSVLKEKTLALGMLWGSMLSCMFLIIVGLKKRFISVGWPNFRNQNIQILIRQFPSKISSSVIHGLNPIVDQYFSAQLTAGALATLNYGNKITLVLIGLVTIPISSTLLPYFSERAAESRKLLYSYLKRILGTSLGVMSIITLVMIVLSKLIIILVFERGSFTSENTEEVYVIQQLYLIQLPFYVCAIIMNRYLNAVNKNNFLVLSSIVNLMMNIILNYVFLQWMGIKGIALATSVVYFINASIIYIYIKKLESKSF